MKIVLLAEAQRRFVAEYYGHDREHDVVEVHTISGAHRERGPRL